MDFWDLYCGQSGIDAVVGQGIGPLWPAHELSGECGPVWHWVAGGCECHRCEVLLVGRAIHGFGAGGIFPVARAVVGDVFPVEQRGRALGLIGAVFGIAFLVGPMIGGVLLMFGWPWLFWVNLPIVVLIIGLGLCLLPNTRGTESKPLDVLGSVLISAILIALAYGLQGIGSQSVGMYAIVGALIAVPVFVWVERRAVDPVVTMALFGRRQIVLVLALAFGSGIAEAVTL